MGGTPGWEQASEGLNGEESRNRKKLGNTYLSSNVLVATMSTGSLVVVIKVSLGDGATSTLRAHRQLKFR